MNNQVEERLEVRKNIYDLARELSIIVDEIDRKKGVKKQIKKNA